MPDYHEPIPLLTVREVATLLRVSPSLVYQLVEGRQLAAHRIGNRHGAIRIAAADVQDYLARCRSERQEDKPKPTRPRLKHVKL
ncbi:MAG: helix-turn-helix domain-containing protein [Pirellulaceae bacterium]|jgi:excisionase family DNA binding protein